MRSAPFAALIGLAAATTAAAQTSRFDVGPVARDFQDSSSARLRGGVLMGPDSAIKVTSHFSIVPELRFVYGGPARIGDKYRECGAGLRAAWRF